MTDIRGVSEQATPAIVQDNDFRSPRLTRDGLTFTAGWQLALLMEGRLHQMTVGTVTGGGDIAPITGGGAGTIIDQDQPEFGVSVPANTTLIPVSIIVSCNVDADAADEVADIIVTADAAAAYAGDGTVVDETPLNMITRGGITTVATAFSAATVDITDPTVSAILATETITQLGTAGFATLRMDYQPAAPFFIQGPGAFYGYWGGTGAVTGIATIIWAEVPSSRYALS